MVIVIAIIFPIRGDAGTVCTANMSSNERLQENLEKIKEELSDAEVRVVDDVIHIVVKALSGVSNLLSGDVYGIQTTATTVVSRIGGPYRNFNVLVRAKTVFSGVYGW